MSRVRPEFGLCNTFFGGCMKRKRKLYVGCALQFAPPEFVTAIRVLREELKEHFQVLEFKFPHPGSNRDVYTLDIKKHIVKCDLMLAICDHPSTGLGYEMATAIEKHNKYVLCLAHTKAGPSRLILGITSRRYEFNRYDSIFEIKQLLLNFEERRLRERKRK